MSVLTLIRHAQASFHADQYDQLSPLGEKQARLLGEAWIQQQRVFDEVYVGPRSRQQHTAELVVAVYRQSGIPFPEPVVLPELDEYDLNAILHRLAPDLAHRDAEFASHFERQRSGTTDRDRERSFQQMFEPLMRHWQTADSLVEELESWPTFRQRVERGLKRMTDQPGHGRRVAAFTSGGFIGTAMQQVLGAPDHAALEINWRIRNAALTEFVFARGGITLDSFNGVAHLADPELVTYR